MPETLNYAIIGCGDVVEKKSGPSIIHAPKSDIRAVMRRDFYKAQSYAQSINCEIASDDADEIINRDDIDIVYIATPPSSHLEYVLAAAKAGKHILVEKPMAMNAAQSAKMVQACTAAGVELFVAYYRRFHLHSVKMTELITSGKLGTIISAEINYAQPPNDNYDLGWRVIPDISGGGVFVDVLSHRIDLMNYLVGRPMEICGQVQLWPGEDRVEKSAALSVKTETGVTVSISGDFASKISADRFVIRGTDGIISTEWLDGYAFSFENSDGRQEFKFDKLPAPHLGLIKHIESVLLTGKPNKCSGADGHLTDIVLDKGLRSHYAS